MVMVLSPVLPQKFCFYAYLSNDKYLVQKFDVSDTDRKVYEFFQD